MTAPTAPPEVRVDAAAWRSLVGFATLFRNSTCLFGALELGLFDHIAPAGSTAAEIAGPAGARELPVRLILNLLAAMGLVRKDGDGRYHLEGPFRELLQSGPGSAAPDLLSFRRENEVWLDMAAILRGRRPAPPDYRDELLRSGLARYGAFEAGHREAVDVVLRRIPSLVAGASAVLDVGGGHGYFAGRVLAANPGATVTVQDLPGGFAMCEARHADLIAAGRLRLLAADARTHDHDRTYDLVHLHELLELFPRPDKLAIVRRALAALEPGGTLAISKFSLDVTGTRPAAAAMFSLRMLLKTSGAAYLETDDEVLELIDAAGGVATSVDHLDGGRTLVLATQPGSPRIARPAAAVGAGPDPEAVDPAVRELIGLGAMFRNSTALFGALELGLFAGLRDGDATAEQVAATAGISPVGATVLLRLFTGLGLLTCDGDHYSPAPAAIPLLDHGEGSLGAELGAYADENRQWLHMAEAACTGEAPGPGPIRHYAATATYLRGVEISNRPALEALLDGLGTTVEDPLHLVDVGGGHGQFARMFLEQNPGAKATVVDLADAVDVCRELHHDLIATGRLEAVVADARERVPGRFDLAVISDVLHYFDRADKQRILAAVCEALVPGGTLAVSEFDIDPDGVSPGSAASFSLKAYLKTGRGYLATTDERRRLLQAAGLRDVHLMTGGPAGRAVLVGTKTAGPAGHRQKGVRDD